MPDAPDEPAHDAVTAVLSGADEVLGALRAVFAQLAQDPDPGGPVEQELVRLLARRDELTAELGRAAMRLLAAGGRLAIVDVNTPSPTEPEAEVAAPERVPAIEAAPEPAPPPPESEPALVRPRARHTNDDDEGPDLPDLVAILAALGAPEAVLHLSEARIAIARLLTHTEDIDRWLVFPIEVQQALVAYTSSMARNVQDDGPPLGMSEERSLRSWFSRMTLWSSQYKPGYVLGLSRRNGPERDSWLAEAQHWWWWLQGAAHPEVAAGEPPPRMWSSVPGSSRPQETSDEPTAADALEALQQALDDPSGDLRAVLDRVIDAGVPQRDPQLVRTLAPHTARVATVPGFKTLKTAIKDHLAVDEKVDEDTDRHARVDIPPDWPYRPLVEGRHAVMLGGDPRQDAADRICAALEMATVTWEENLPRRIEAIEARVRSRTIDLVIFLRGFLGHSEMSTLIAACKETSVPWVSVDAGYGVSQVRLSIERYLKPLLSESHISR